MTEIPEGVSFRFYMDIVDSDGVAVNLTGGTAVINLENADETIELAATISNAATGSIYADATPAQMSRIGNFTQWAEVTWSNGRVVKTGGTLNNIVHEGTEVS